MSLLSASCEAVKLLVQRLRLVKSLRDDLHFRYNAGPYITRSKLDLLDIPRRKELKPGPEVTAEAVRVLETITKHTDLDITLEQKDFGGIAIDNHGEPLPDDTLKSCMEADAILLGRSVLPICVSHSIERSRLRQGHMEVEQFGQ